MHYDGDLRINLQVTVQQGFALISVLWVLTIMTLLATIVVADQRQTSAATRLWLQQAQTRHAVEGAIHQTIYQLLTRQIQPGADNELLTFSVAGQKQQVQILSEAGKADLNQVTEPLLRQLISSLNVDEQSALELTDAILDWRDGDELVRLNGAEQRDYEQADHPFLPANKPFQDLSELQRVIGMNPAIYLQLKPLFTLHTGQNSIDLAAASPAMLKALERENNNSKRQFFSAGSSRLLSIHATSNTPGQALLELQTIVALQPTNTIEPFHYLSWKFAVPGISEQATALLSESGGHDDQNQQ